jgi:hypothetical protein
MLKSSSIFKRNSAHLVEKRTFGKNKDCPFLRFGCFEHANIFLFVSSFEHVKFAINGKYTQKFYDNPNCYVSLVIF